MATIGLSKVFILDKYFTELQKFWETERKVQGILKKLVYAYRSSSVFFLFFGVRSFDDNIRGGYFVRVEITGTTNL